MILAPVLQDVAAGLTGADPALRRDDPVRWAYALRDALALVRPDWVVTHHDLDLEAGDVLAQAGDVDAVFDADPSAGPALGAGLELTQTLAALYPGGIVAASVTGPATLAGRLAPSLQGTDGDDGLSELMDACGDLLSEVAALHAARGAARIVVWEPEPAGTPELIARAHKPLVRRLALLQTPAALAGAAIGEGYVASEGAGLALVPAAETGDLGSWRSAAGAAGPGGVVLSDGPLPADCDPVVLRRLGERDLDD